MTRLAKNVHALRAEQDAPTYNGSGASAEPYIWGITGAVGGVGVTNLCTQFAYWLSKSNKTADLDRPKICLLELDFENGSLSHYLDSAPKIRFESFCEPADRLDQDLIKSWLTDTAYGFSFLSLPNVIDGNRLVNADTILACLDHICELFDYIVLDIPQLWSPWTHAALGASDQVAIMTELNIPALHLARSRSSALIDAVETLNKTDFIVNKFERRSFRGSLKLGDAERALEIPIVKTIAMNHEPVREAMNRGEPVGVTYSESRFVRDSNEIFENWLKQAMVRNQALKAAY